MILRNSCPPARKGAISCSRAGRARLLNIDLERYRPCQSDQSWLAVSTAEPALRLMSVYRLKIEETKDGYITSCTRPVKGRNETPSAFSNLGETLDISKE